MADAVQAPTKSYNMQLEDPDGGGRIMGQFEATSLENAVKEFHDYIQKHHPSAYRNIRREGGQPILKATDSLEFISYRITGTKRWGSGGRTFEYTALKKRKW